MGIELVAHSPLKRARQTSHGMLQTVSPSLITTDVTIDSSAEGAKHPSISRVVELELLTERTPMEWLPTHYDEYAKRIRDFEKWLSQQEEDVIAIVGHSQYFRSMLGLKSKFKNVDVWSLKLDCGAIGDTNDCEDEKKDDVLVDMKEEEDDKEEKDNGIVNEIDGVPLEDLILPRGWKLLRHHYRYDPEESSTN
jgi:broad specificity phosphatase PhoE